VLLVLLRVLMLPLLMLHLALLLDILVLGLDLDNETRLSMYPVELSIIVAGYATDAQYIGRVVMVSKLLLVLDLLTMGMDPGLSK
jgi:hypothetical protein